MICAVRRDTAMYGLPSEERKTVQAWRKDKGRRDPTKEDHSTRIFGNQPALAIVTKSSKKDTGRLFISTHSAEELHELNALVQLDVPDKEDVLALIARLLKSTDMALGVYHFHWHIEVRYMEQKDYQNLGGYMIRR